MMLLKKISYSVVSLAVALVMYEAMKNTCPPKDRHMRAVTEVVQRITDQIFQERIHFPEESRELARYLSTEVIPQAVKEVMNQKVNFTNYGIFSIGKINDATITLGAVNTVYTIHDEQISEVLNKVITEESINQILQQLNINKEHDGQFETE